MAKQGEHGIGWTEHTWNPIRGCSRVSEGCRHCYAESIAARFSGPGQPYEGLAITQSDGPHWTGKVELVLKHLEDPIHWKRPRRIFVNSMSDLFHESLPENDIVRIIDVAIRALRTTPHIFQFLTKRPKRMMEILRKIYPMHIDRHLWFGVSIEDWKTAQARVPMLLDTPAAIRWLSIEPLLGPVNVGHWLPHSSRIRQETVIDWVVVGGESGCGARPMDPAWVRALRDDCVAYHTPFFFKQWGSYMDASEALPEHPWYRCGKTAQDLKGGNVLDGRKWEEYPVVEGK